MNIFKSRLKEQSQLTIKLLITRQLRDGETLLKKKSVCAS